MFSAGDVSKPCVLPCLGVPRYSLAGGVLDEASLVDALRPQVPRGVFDVAVAEVIETRRMRAAGGGGGGGDGGAGAEVRGMIALDGRCVDASNRASNSSATNNSNNNNTNNNNTNNNTNNNSNNKSRSPLPAPVSIYHHIGIPSTRYIYVH